MGLAGAIAQEGRWELLANVVVMGGVSGICLYYYLYDEEEAAEHTSTTAVADDGSGGDLQAAAVALGLSNVFDTALFVWCALYLYVVPNDFINLPHKDVLLAPSMRERTLLVLGRRLLRISIATQLYLLVLMVGIGAAEVEERDTTAVVLGATGSYCIYVAWWCWALYLWAGRLADANTGHLLR